VDNETFEAQMLVEAKAQTKAVELLAVLAQIWSVLFAIGIVLWLIAVFAS